jgi:hypothetical protein
MALHSTSGQNGHMSQTIYNVMEGHNNDTNDDTLTTITQIAAATTTMSTASTVSTAVNNDIAAAINQLLANQTAIMSQMAALLFSPAPAQQMHWFVACNAFQVPPIQQVAIPLQQIFLLGTFLWDMGDAMAVATASKDRVDKVVLCSRTTYRLQEPCQQCLAKLSFMGTTLSRRLCNNRLQTWTFPMCTNGTIVGMCVSCAASTLRMATHPSLAPSKN